MVVSAGRCRLEVLVRGRRVMLLDDAEDAFWTRFYAPVRRERLRLGERIVETETWRKPISDLIAVLTPYWHDRVELPLRPAAEPGPGA